VIQAAGGRTHGTQVAISDQRAHGLLVKGLAAKSHDQQQYSQGQDRN
jgi:hypothetical protein